MLSIEPIELNAQVIIMKLSNRYVETEVPGRRERYSNIAPSPMSRMVLRGYEHMNYYYPFGCASCVHPLN